MTPAEQTIFDSIYLPDGALGGQERLVPRPNSQAETPEGALMSSGSKCPRWKGGVVVRNNYRYIFLPQHPRVDNNGYVREHILVAERALGEFLKDDEVVHHLNEDTLDNRQENLMVCESEAVHQIIHRRARAFYACGNPDWLRCILCKKHDDPEKMYVRIYRDGRCCWGRHRKCHAESEKQRSKVKALCLHFN